MKNAHGDMYKSLWLRKTMLVISCMLLFLVVGIMQSRASIPYAQLTKLSLELKNATVGEAIAAIEQKSSFYFTYNLSQVNVARKVSIKATNKTVTEILDNLFLNEGIEYTINGKHIVLYKDEKENASIQVQGVQQSKKRVGTIVDTNGEVIIGANVLEKGTTNGTITDVEGKFSIQVADNAILMVSYIGYTSKEIPVGNNSSLTITLKDDSEILSEIVVVGYGTQRKGSLATSISSVKAEALQNRPVQTIGEALQGQVAGLSIVSSGQPGKSPSIRLRGVTSLNDKDDSGAPLILVDGVPSDFNYLNPEDIESINVLKDAASAAIYGSRAANGVLLVTTKRGKSGKPTFRYNGSFGVHTPTAMPEVCSSAVFARISNEAEKNVGRADIYLPEEIALYENGTDPNRYPNTNWMDLAIQNSITTRHGIEASGGTETVKYLVSAGLDHQTGVLPQMSQNVFNIRSNTDIAVSKKFNISFDMRYQLRKADELLDVADVYNRILAGDPTKIAYYTDGTYGYNSGFFINPLVDLYESGNKLYDRHDASGIFKFDYEIIDGLKFTGLANVNYVFSSTDKRTKQKNYKDFFTQAEYTSGENSLSNKRDYKEYYNLQALLTYKKTFKKHSLDVLAGYQQENEKSNWIQADRNGYPTDLVWVLNAGPKANWSNDGNAEHWAIASVIGRLNYDYANKYLLSASFRSDASSRFATENRWSTFPSIAFAWRVSQESFMEKTSGWLNDLKVRASWGQNGSATGLGLYPSYTTISMGSEENVQAGVVLNNQWLLSAKLKNLGNIDLGWERTEMFDLGLNFTVLNNRLTFTGDYYVKTTKDILIGLPVPMEYGFGKPNVNIGKMRNRGWELELSWNDRIGSVNYGISANISDNRNEVLDLAGTGPWKDGYTDEGLPFKSIYGYESLGLFQSDEEVKEAPFQNSKTGKGDVRYKDQNDDNKIDANDRVVLGDRNPHYLYGINLSAGYKGFDLSAMFQGVGQKEMILNDGTVRPLYNSPVYEHQLDYWSETNTGAKYPRILNKDDGEHNYAISDFWKINAGYLRMKNLQIGYTFPGKLLAPTGFSRVRVYLSASNLFTISNFVPGFDPEISAVSTYPFSRTFSFGLNVQF